MKRLLLVALVSGVLVAACGVPTDDAPRAVDEDALPSSLTGDAGLSSTTVFGTARESVAVYFIRDDAVVRVEEEVNAPADLSQVLSLLQTGPSAEEADKGVRSALTGTELIRSAQQTGSTAAVDLGSALEEIAPADQILALAQIVLTATSRPGVERVRLSVDGEATQVPTGDGSLTTEPLRRADYAELLTP